MVSGTSHTATRSGELCQGRACLHPEEAVGPLNLAAGGNILQGEAVPRVQICQRKLVLALEHIQQMPNNMHHLLVFEDQNSSF
jgi:hypothetical protein